jgi:hypothetical protein
MADKKLDILEFFEQMNFEQMIPTQKKYISLGDLPSFPFVPRRQRQTRQHFLNKNILANISSYKNIQK